MAGPVHHTHLGSTPLEWQGNPSVDSEKKKQLKKLAVVCMPLNKCLMEPAFSIMSLCVQLLTKPRNDLLLKMAMKKKKN